MNSTQPRRSGHRCRRTVLQDSLAGLVGLCMSGLVGTFMPLQSFGQIPHPSRKHLDGWICAYDFIGATADPLVYYYYAGDCPTDDGQYYGMTSPVSFPTYSGCPSDAGSDPGCNPRYSTLKPPSKQLPGSEPDTLIDLSKNPMKRHFILVKNGIDLGQKGLPKLGGPNVSVSPNAQNGATIMSSTNFQMMISGRRRAVRVFVLDVMAGVKKTHVKVGIGQEIDADPTGLPMFDDERPGAEPKHYMGYMKDKDQFYHILTKN